MKRRVVALCSGLLFSIGLALAGMTRPSKIRAFLDVSGEWDPSLLLVMVGAIAVYATAYGSSRRMKQTLTGDTFAAAPGGHVDARLLLGASLFGVGWGLSGFCPGPAVAALGAGNAQAAWFVPALLTGLWSTRYALARRSASLKPPPRPA